VHLNTRVVVDHSEDGVFQVNFKITLPELSCEVRGVAHFCTFARHVNRALGVAQWAAIDSVDIVGNRRRHDLSNSAIYKCAHQRRCAVALACADAAASS
jgi:hypothetical protein